MDHGKAAIQRRVSGIRSNQKTKLEQEGGKNLFLSDESLRTPCGRHSGIIRPDVMETEIR